jgi:hypothetical protein
MSSSVSASNLDQSVLRGGKRLRSSTEMRTMPSAFGRSSFSRRDDSDVFAPSREDDDKRFGFGEADCNIPVFCFVGFVPRENPAPEDLDCIFEADPVLALVAFCFFMIPFKSGEVEFERFPMLFHSSLSKSFDQN